MKRKRSIWWWKVMKQYLANCNIHGVRYLVDDQLSYTERIFWLISCGLCWWGCADMIIDVIRQYIKQPVEVTVDTMYLDWETPFPSFALCILSNSAIKASHFKQDPGAFSNYSFRSVADATSEELLNLYDKLKFPCKKFMHRCTWNNVEFDCCTEFRELYKTGVGHCFTINSVHTRKSDKEEMKFIVNRTIKYGDLIVDLVANKTTKSFFPKSFEVYAYNRLEIPMVSTSEENRKIKMKPGKLTRVDFSIKNIFNERGVKKFNIEQRSCRFLDEVPKDSYLDIYTTYSCTLEIIIRRMIKFCGCVHFYYMTPPGARTCSMPEMQCILANKSEIMLTTKLSSCLPNCERPLLKMYEHFIDENNQRTDARKNRYELSDHDAPPDGFSRIHFSLLNRPTMRIRRYVVHDMLNVVVSIGSAIGLFMGASILSVFEIPYWLFVRRDRIS